jgi:hypothetical protein
MFRSVAALIVSVALGPVSPAAPRLKEAKPAHYFPVGIGDKRVLEFDTPKGKEELAEVVTAVTEHGGGLLVTTRIECHGGAGSDHQFEVSDRGVTRVVAYGLPFRTPVCHLRLPFKPGETWDTDDQLVGQVVYCRAKFTAEAEEEVEVPAGKFRAVRVRVASGQGLGETTHWYARGVGVVRSVSKQSGRDEEDRVTVLKSFTPGKK